MIDPSLPTGEITNMTVPWLFKALHAAKKTGTAVFTRDAAIKKVYVAAGEVVFASSSLNEDRLGEWLVRAGTITRQQRDESAELVSPSGKKHGTILVEQGVITPRELVDGVKFQVRQIIISLFSWRSGLYAFDEGPLPARDIIPLKMSTGNLIIEGLRGLEWQVIRASLPPLTTIIRPAADPSHLFQQADLEQDHQTVLLLMDGKKSIEEICALAEIGDFNTLKAVYVLLALRMAEKGELKTKEEMMFAREAVRETIAARGRKPAKPDPEQPATREALQDAYDRMDRQDLYELLGVGRSATPQEIKKAYFSLAMRYHPDRHFSADMSVMKEKLEALFDAIHDAYTTLADPEKRAQFDRDLARGAPKRRTERARAEQPDNRALAEAQFNEGMKLFNAGDFWSAEEAFQWATHLDPGNAEYVFRRGLNLSRMPRRGHDAEESLARAVVMEPSNIGYYLELGKLYGRLGLKAKALAVYQDALKQDPHSDLTREALGKIREAIAADVQK
jgi:tetratricopeptide (TPR) repeat protein